MTDEQARRVGLNEALFREVNEEIRGLTSSFGTDEGTMTVVCECGSASCTDQIEVGIATYERVRAESRLYIVAHGHVFPEVESVVEQNEGWEVVRKHEGIPADVARETDPRT